MEIALFFYSLTLLALGGVVLSYGIAYRLTKSLSVLSLLLFFIAIFMVVVVIVCDMAQAVMGFRPHKLPFMELRGLYFFLTTAFLFYTTWRVDKSKLKK